MHILRIEKYLNTVALNEVEETLCKKIWPLF